MKYFLRGLGLGMVFSVILLTVFINRNRQAPMSNDDIMKRASGLGMLTQEEVDDLLLDKSLEKLDEKKADENQAPAETQVPQPKETAGAAPPQRETPLPKEALEETTSKASAGSPAPTVAPTTLKSPMPTVLPASTVLPSPDATSVTDEKKREDQVATITVTAGMASENVAVKLKEAGLINDSDKFNKFLVENGYASFIRIGTFRIPSGAGFEKIAKILTE